VKRLFSWIIFAVSVIYGASYLLHRFPLATQAQPAQEPQLQTPLPPEATEANKAVTFVGPLANYAQSENQATADSRPAVPWTPHAIDHVGDSPVGTGGVILHKTFAIATTVKFPFEIPAHATSPQLRGTYHSFLRQAGDSAADGDPNVEFLLMNQQQYADFAQGRQADVLYFVQSSHSQQVNFELAPTFDNPAQYCLVFRNHSGGATKKIVQADFSVDY
jgi:hypothetical protein